MRSKLLTDKVNEVDTKISDIDDKFSDADNSLETLAQSTNDAITWLHQQTIAKNKAIRQRFEAEIAELRHATYDETIVDPRSITHVHGIPLASDPPAQLSLRQKIIALVNIYVEATQLCT